MKGSTHGRTSSRGDREKTFNDAVADLQRDAADLGWKSRDEAGRALQDTENVLAEARKIVGNDIGFLSAKDPVAAALNPPGARSPSSRRRWLRRTAPS